jgi:hypothetical protein
MASKPKPNLASYNVKVQTPPPAPAPSKSAPQGGDDRKLITLRVTHDQRRYLQRVAFDQERTVQDLIVAALDDYLASKGLDPLSGSAS